MNALIVLREVRTRMADPNMWQKGDQGSDGAPQCVAGHLVAVCEQLAACDLKMFRLLGDARRALRPFHQKIALQDYNDTHTHPEVLNLLDKAIASLTPSTPNPVLKLLEFKPEFELTI